MTGTVVDTAQTYGWDTVFAMHIDDVNAAIVAQKSSPPSFAQDDPDEGYSIAGKFGDWAIVPGGDGDLVCLGLPIRDTIVTGPGSKWSVSGTIRAMVRLDLLHDAEVAARRHLKVRTTAVAPNTPVATVVGSSFSGGGAPPFIAQTALQMLMQDWLNANLADFDHVFSTVDLDHRAASGAFQWMQPTDVAYAYTDLGTATDGALAILSMTGGRSSEGLIQQVSNACIPDGHKGSLLISKARVIDQLLLPTIPFSYKDSKASDFILSSTGQSITIGANSVSFTVTNNGDTYTASVESSSVTIQGRILTYDVTTKTDLSPGIRAWCHTINRLNLTLGKAADGGQTITFTDADAPDVTHWTDHDPGIDIAEKVLAIAALVAGVVATVLTDGAAVGVLALAIGFAAGVLMVTQTAIENAGENKAPSITAAVLDATAAIKWPQSSGFVLSQATLNDSLQLIGAYAAGSSPAEVSPALRSMEVHA